MNLVPPDTTRKAGGKVLVDAPVVMLERASIALVVVVLGSALHRIFITNVNWDEFYYLALVHSYLNGELAARLQTIHVHFFAWLGTISENEMDQVIAARAVMWLLGVGSAWLIYRIARRYLSKLGALVAVLSYLCFSFVLQHGQSFRVDPISAFLFLGCLQLQLDETRSRRRFALAGALLGLSFLFTIKTVFYLPVIGAVLAAPLIWGPGRAEAIQRALAFAAGLCGTAAALYALHDQSLSHAATETVEGYVSAAGAKVIMFDQLFPRLPYIARAVVENLAVWAFILLGAWKAAIWLVRGPDRKTGLILLSFVLPLGSLAIYRNAFPYFFVFLMPSAAVLSGVFADELAKRIKSTGSRIATVLLGAAVLLLGATFIGDYIRKLPDQTVAQRETLELVHELFPEPVPYIDRNSMVASYPKAGFFMTTWGMESYRAAGRRIMRDLLIDAEPQFLIVNTAALDLSRPLSDERRQSTYRLFPDDFRILRDNFVHHWGRIYVPGKSFDLGPASPAREFEILIGGEYTLEAQGPVIIDSVEVRPGEQLRLDRDRHRISSSGVGQRAVLRWGRNLDRPERAPSPQPIYYEL